MKGVCKWGRGVGGESRKIRESSLGGGVTFAPHSDKHLRTHTRTRVRAHILTNMHIKTHTRTHTHTHTHTRPAAVSRAAILYLAELIKTCACVCARARVRVCVCVYTHTHTHTHTHLVGVFLVHGAQGLDEPRRFGKLDPDLHKYKNMERERESVCVCVCVCACVQRLCSFPHANTMLFVFGPPVIEYRSQFLSLSLSICVCVCERESVTQACAYCV
jgi:hypothetical protein